MSKIKVVLYSKEGKVKTGLSPETEASQVYIASESGTPKAVGGKAPAIIERVEALDTTLAGKAPMSHTHTIDNVTGLQVDLTAIRESISNVSSKVDDIDDPLSLVKKQTILDACDQAMNSGNPVHTGDPTLDEIKSALATIQAQLGQLGQLGQLENRRYVKEAGKSSDGMGWYRKWSDGFIEQGGQITSAATEISLHTAFTNTNYTISSSQAGADSSVIPRVAIKARTPSKFTLEFCSVTMLPISWNACGY